MATLTYHVFTHHGTITTLDPRKPLLSQPIKKESEMDSFFISGYKSLPSGERAVSQISVFGQAVPDLDAISELCPLS